MSTRMRSGTLPEPLVIVAIGSSELLLVQAKDADNPNADAQMYELDQEAMFEEIKPLPIWYKFLYGVDGVSPPILWTEDERVFRVKTYQARLRARAAATHNED